MSIGHSNPFALVVGYEGFCTFCAMDCAPVEPSAVFHVNARHEFPLSAV